MDKYRFISEILTNSKKCQNFEIQECPKNDLTDERNFKGVVYDPKIGYFYFKINFSLPVINNTPFFKKLIAPLLCPAFIYFYKIYDQNHQIDMCQIPQKYVYTLYEIIKKIEKEKREKEKKSIFVDN